VFSTTEDNIQYPLLQELLHFQAQSLHESLESSIQRIMDTNGECFPAVGHIARYRDGGAGGRGQKPLEGGAKRSHWFRN